MAKRTPKKATPVTKRSATTRRATNTRPTRASARDEFDDDETPMDDAQVDALISPEVDAEIAALVRESNEELLGGDDARSRDALAKFREADALGLTSPDFLAKFR